MWLFSKGSQKNSPSCLFRHFFSHPGNSSSLPVKPSDQQVASSPGGSATGWCWSCSTLDPTGSMAIASPNPSVAMSLGGAMINQPRL